MSIQTLISFPDLEGLLVVLSVNCHNPKALGFFVCLFVCLIPAVLSEILSENYSYVANTFGTLYIASTF